MEIVCQRLKPYHLHATKTTCPIRSGQPFLTSWAQEFQACSREGPKVINSVLNPCACNRRVVFKVAPKKFSPSFSRSHKIFDKWVVLNFVWEVGNAQLQEVMQRMQHRWICLTSRQISSWLHRPPNVCTLLSGSNVEFQLCFDHPRHYPGDVAHGHVIFEQFWAVAWLKSLNYD